MTACLSIGAQAPAQAMETLRFGHLLPQQSRLGAGASAFAADVARRTGGRFHVEQYPNAMLGGEVEMMRSVQLGMVDLAFTIARIKSDQGTAPAPAFVSTQAEPSP